MKKFSQLSLISASLLLGWATQAVAGPIYECNGIYTDKPSASCRGSAWAAPASAWPRATTSTCS